MDMHEDIHRASEAYFDGDEFRRYLNAAIQNSRSVSFLVQKRKSRWSNFAEWYDAWSTEAAANHVMRWGVRSRNRIVKEEDLKTLSVAELTYYGTRHQEGEDIILVPPYIAPEHILDVFSDLIERDKPRGGGAIRVTRKWIDDQLPEYELIDALRELYAGVEALVREAHVRAGSTRCAVPTFTRPCVTSDLESSLRCLPPGPISASIDLKTGKVYEVHRRFIPRDDAAMPGLAAKYGLRQSFGHGPVEDIDQRLLMAKTFLENDGFVGTGMYFYQGHEVARIVPFALSSQHPDELAIVHTLETVGATPFDGVMFASESWVNVAGDAGEHDSTMIASPFYDPDPRGGRGEAITIYGFSRQGNTRSLVVRFHRNQTPIAYETLVDSTDARLVPRMLIDPVWRHWASGAHNS
ncbi:hypothetical protein [Microbacterium sp. Gd 4-13]|uniref:hypothetical protein n=1 Tax=Microbacterium sp. Gd 4-13 TaxID=2173179 RepID=UPI001057ADA9|nr:hypothetical protein [Microbacterium sp. Gd 4-13]